MAVGEVLKPYEPVQESTKCNTHCDHGGGGMLTLDLGAQVLCRNRFALELLPRQALVQVNDLILAPEAVGRRRDVQHLIGSAGVVQGGGCVGADVIEIYRNQACMQGQPVNGPNDSKVL